MGDMAAPTVSAVLVGYNSAPADLIEAIASLGRQSLTVTQIVCVDQSSDGRFERALAEVPEPVEVISTRRNLGYSLACNLGAERATGDYLLLLNPDATADPACVERLVAVAEADPAVAIVGAQVLLPGALRVNAGDNPIHISGLCWSGRYGESPEDGPPRQVAAVSGAALLIRRSAWDALGGCTEGFFMYYDDADLAWRAQLAGWRVMFCPAAHVEHSYDFVKGGFKWRWLERNRWWCVLAHYRIWTLLLLAPLLLAVESAIWLYALREGWTREKLGSWVALWKDRRALINRRREIQRTRVVSDRVILERMTATVQTPLLGPRAERFSGLIRAYRRIVLACVG